MEWWIWVLIGIAVVAVVAIVAYAIEARKRREQLRDHFGSEYDRTVDDADSTRKGERDLRDRLKQHRKLELRPLDPDTAARYSEEWMVVQARFVDEPNEACVRGEQLLERVLRDRGYPVDEDFDTQADLVSVDHPELVGDYRRAHDMLHDGGSGTQPLETLRSVFTVHRDLFSDLLDTNGHPASERAPAREVDREVDPEIDRERDREIDLTRSERYERHDIER